MLGLQPLRGDRATLAVLKPKAVDITALTDLRNTCFYSRRAIDGHNELLDDIKPVVGGQSDTFILLACTDLASAFPDKSGEMLFQAEGVNFFDTIAAHVDAIIKLPQVQPRFTYIDVGTLRDRCEGAIDAEIR